MKTHAFILAVVCLVAATARPTGSWVQCTPRRQLPLCTNCTKAELKQAIKQCFPLTFAKPIRRKNQPVIMYWLGDNTHRCRGACGCVGVRVYAGVRASLFARAHACASGCAIVRAGVRVFIGLCLIMCARAYF